MPTRKTKRAVEIVDAMIGGDEELRSQVEEETVNSRVASLIHEARTRAGLTQQQLAELIGTKQPVVARLENADYEGHSLSMLVRIAEALDNRVEIRFVPRTARRTA